MQLYEVSPTAGVKSTWHGTRDAAHAEAKTKLPREDVRIYLWDAPVVKDNVLEMIAGREFNRGTFLGAWSLTARGGLLELERGYAFDELAQHTDDTAPSAPTDEDLDAL